MEVNQPRKSGAEKLDLILLSISQEMIERIERDKSMYLPFGPIGSSRHLYGDKAFHSRVRKYMKYLNETKNKSQFDAYKTLYQMAIKRSVMKTSYYSAVKLRYPVQFKSSFMYWGSVPFMHDRWCMKYGKTTLSRFMIFMAIYNTYLTAQVEWSNFRGFTKTMVECFSHEMSTMNWQISLNYLIKRGFIEMSQDQDLMRYYFKAGVDSSNHPVVHKILKETFYVITLDGIRVFRAFSEQELEYIDRINHNGQFFRKSNMAESIKKDFDFWQKKYKKTRARKTKGELNKLRAKHEHIR